MVTIDFRLADIKLDSSSAYLLKLGKICYIGFRSFLNFRKNAVLNICRYLKLFYTHKKINIISLKFDHSFIEDTKNWHGNRLNRHMLKNAIQKHNQHANKYVRATLI